mmetsp:Transcript_43519/g.141166  ORF Transcript_43519/g.141166 Transcript_43519/m.141166 type:complete len:484 (+) Transcript_43519:434-1885(+)
MSADAQAADVRLDVGGGGAATVRRGGGAAPAQLMQVGLDVGLDVLRRRLIVERGIELGHAPVGDLDADKPLLAAVRAHAAHADDTHHLDHLEAAVAPTLFLILKVLLDDRPEWDHRAADQVLLLHPLADRAPRAVLAVRAVAAHPEPVAVERLPLVLGGLGRQLGEARCDAFGEALKAVRQPKPRVWAVDAVRVDVRARHGKRAHGPLDQEGERLDAVGPLLLAANQRPLRDVESLSRVELPRLVRLCLFVQHLHRALEGEAAVDVQLEVQQRHARDRVLLHLAREVGRDLDRLAADVDDAVVELAVLLGDAHLLLQDGHEVVEDLVLHLDAHAEQPVEEAFDAPLVVGVDADRGDRLLGVVQVLLPPRVQLVVRLEPERTAHVRRRRPGRREERVAEQLDELVVRLLAPLGVDVEHREVRRVGSAPIPLGDGAELLQPLGHRRCEAALAAAGCHEQLVLRPVDLVGAMRAAALLDALVGGPR